MTYPPPQGQQPGYPPQQAPGQQPPNFQQPFSNQPPAYQQPQYQQPGPQPGFPQQGYQQPQNYSQQDPFHAPLPGASMGQAFGRYFKKYATFGGRASRSEYWWVALGLFLLNLIPQALIWTGFYQGLDRVGLLAGNISLDELDYVLNDPYYTAEIFGSGLLVIGGALAGLIAVITFIPSLALLWRRLHDANQSGAMVLVALIPVIGSFILLFFLLSSSNPAGQRFDPQPARFR